ncbi:MAG TPA: PAS domain-containing protein [Polyangiaceae bacterium]|jgi:PAS domain S-box-containing protein|nr:PAS domain-containing protein [Polyangiaceae bacterium]
MGSDEGEAMANHVGEIADALPGLLWTTRSDGSSDFVNRRFYEYTGLGPSQAFEYGWRQAVHPDDVTSFVECWDAIRRSGIVKEIEARLRRFDGEYRWFVFRLSPLGEERNGERRWCWLGLDVDETPTDPERPLLDGRLRRFLDMLPTQVVLMTPDLQIEFVNRQLLDFYGMSVEQLKAWYASGAVHPDDVPETYARLSRLLSSGEVFDGENRMRRADGTYRHVHARMVPSKDAHGNIVRYCSVQNDVEELKHAQALLAGEVQVLEMVARGKPLREILDTVSRLVEALCGCVCIIGEISGVFTIYRGEPVSPTPDEQDTIDRFSKIVGIAIDRAQSDEALRASATRLRTAHAQLAEGQRLSATGSFTSDLQLDRHSWSEEYYRIFELDPATPPSVQAARNRVHPDDLEIFDSEIQSGLEGGDADFSFRILTPASGLKYLRGVARVIDHVEGRPIFIGTVRDETESKLAEAALKANEAALRQAYSYLTEAQRLSQTGSFTWDVLADEHNWSEEIRRIFGFDLDAKVTIRMIQAAIYPGDKAEVERVIGGAAEGRDFDLVFRILTTGGEVRHAHVVGHRMDHIEDRPVFLGALQDVTESKAAEAALRTSEAELRRTNRFLVTAQKLSKTGSFIWDPGTNERQWSEEMYRIFEQDPERTAPSAMTEELIHPEDLSTFDALIRRAGDGHDFDGEFRLLMQSGKVKNLHVVGHSLNGSLVGAAQDVTELKLREDALNAARLELAHVARATSLSMLTASIAHEVSQPLSGILTNMNACLRMLAAELPNLEGVADTARRTIRDINRATEVIKRLRALFARKTPTIEPFDLNEAAREVIALTASELQRSGVIVQTEFAGDLPTVHGDRIQLQQVILNLMLNAADAMSEIEDRQRITVVQTHRDREKRVELSVCDAGLGIDTQTSEKLFDAFYTTKAHGMGVGLSISRSIIENHEGRLWASANDGFGATFSSPFPAREEWRRSRAVEIVGWRSAMPTLGRRADVEGSPAYTFVQYRTRRDSSMVLAVTAGGKMQTSKEDRPRSSQTRESTR